MRFMYPAGSPAGIQQTFKNFPAKKQSSGRRAGRPSAAVSWFPFYIQQSFTGDLQLDSSNQQDFIGLPLRVYRAQYYFHRDVYFVGWISSWNPAKNRVQGGGLGGLRPLSPGFHFTFSKVSLEIYSWIPARFQLHSSNYTYNSINIYTLHTAIHTQYTQHPTRINLYHTF